jgi:SAM-dependent methyltransferase
MFHSPYRWIPVVSDVYRTGCRQAAKIRFAGSRVECPLCERTFSRWRGHAMLGNCPFCGSAPRHRLLKLSLAREWNHQSRPLDVLHFAPEWGVQRGFRSNPRVGRYVTADLSAPGVDVHCDITALDFADQEFDVVVCSHVLEHVRDDRRALKELRRVLRPGGVAYIQVPYDSNRHTDEDPNVTDPVERERRYGQFDHIRMYGRDLIGRLSEAGFKVDELRPTREMAGEEIVRWGLWDDNIFRCQVERAS